MVCAFRRCSSSWRTMQRKGVMARGGREQAHRAQKLTRQRALCAVSEPETSPYCVSPRVAFVSALVAPIVFCPHTRRPLPPPAPCAPFVSPASSLSRISPSFAEKSGVEGRWVRSVSPSLSADKGNRCTLVSRATPFLQTDCLLAA